MLLLHRVRQDFGVARTAQANQIRGLLAKFGLVQCLHEHLIGAGPTGW